MKTLLTNRTRETQIRATAPAISWSSVEFVASYRRGDADVLAIVYRAYIDRVDHVLANGFALPGRIVLGGARNDQTRADLLQDVFLKAFAPAARQSYDPARPYAPYILTITRNVLHDWHRKKRRQQALAQRLADSVAATLASPGEDVPDRSYAIDAAASYLASLHHMVKLYGFSPETGSSRF